MSDQELGIWVVLYLLSGAAGGWFGYCTSARFSTRIMREKTPGFLGMSIVTILLGPIGFIPVLITFDHPDWTISL